jgi:hypothetical protein
MAATSGPLRRLQLGDNVIMQQLTRGAAVSLALLGFTWAAPSAAASGKPFASTERLIDVGGVIAGGNSRTGHVTIVTPTGMRLILIVTGKTVVTLNGGRVSLSALKVGDQAEALASARTGLAVRLAAERAMAPIAGHTSPYVDHSRNWRPDAKKEPREKTPDPAKTASRGKERERPDPKKEPRVNSTDIPKTKSAGKKEPHDPSSPDPKKQPGDKSPDSASVKPHTSETERSDTGVGMPSRFTAARRKSVADRTPMHFPSGSTTGAPPTRCCSNICAASCSDICCGSTRGSRAITSPAVRSSKGLVDTRMALPTRRALPLLCRRQP